MKKYIVEFNEDKNDSVESLKTLKEGLQNWLQVFKFPAVERTTYDRAESIAKNQIYPRLGKKIVGDVTAADIKKLLNYWMTEDYAYTTVKKVYVLLNEYFRYLSTHIRPSRRFTSSSTSISATFISRKLSRRTRWRTWK